MAKKVPLTKRSSISLYHGPMNASSVFRANVLAAREAELNRCQLVQADMVHLQQELDRETERLATSLRERREEEEEQILAEVGG